MSRPAPVFGGDGTDRTIRASKSRALCELSRDTSGSGRAVRINVRRLDGYLERLGFGERDFSIGREVENRLCLLPEGDQWLVFFSERGSRWDDVSFDSEEVACTFMLGLLAQQYVEEGPRR